MTTVSNRTLGRQIFAGVVAAALVCSAAMASAAIASADKTAGVQLSRGIAAAQACESEIDDDLTPYGECVGHAADRLAKQPVTLLGLHFQAWLIADLAARQGSTRAAQLRQRYRLALQQGMRHTGLNLPNLCALKSLDCASIAQRFKQQIAKL